MLQRKTYIEALVQQAVPLDVHPCFICSVRRHLSAHLGHSSLKLAQCKAYPSVATSNLFTARAVQADMSQYATFEEAFRHIRGKRLSSCACIRSGLTRTEEMNWLWDHTPTMNWSPAPDWGITFSGDFGYVVDDLNGRAFFQAGPSSNDKGRLTDSLVEQVQAQFFQRRPLQVVTSWPPRKKPGHRWTKREENMLLELRAQGIAFTRIGWRLSYHGADSCEAKYWALRREQT